jgi:hypothetical protein
MQWGVGGGVGEEQAEQNMAEQLLYLARRCYEEVSFLIHLSSWEEPA